MDFVGDKIYKCGDSLSKIYKCGEVVWEKETPGRDYSKEYLTFEFIEGGQMSFVGTHNEEILYSRDGGSTWNTWVAGLGTSSNRISVNAGDIIYFSATGNSGYHGELGPQDTFPNIQTSSKHLIYGNIMSLLDKDNFRTLTDLTPFGDRVFKDIFTVCKVTDASNLILPATTLTPFCYENMFVSCQDLEVAPELPATALKMSCYQGMFSNCRKLTKAPDLNASALTSSCYSVMFLGCLSLNYVKCLAENPSLSPTYASGTWQYLMMVSPTGTFVKKAGVEWPTGDSGIPSGWTVIEEE